MPLIQANGLAFHVQTLGGGPPVVMIHGLFLGNLATWYFTAAPALARHHRVLLYDLRGHGRSAPAASGYDLATMTADLAAILDGAGVSEPADVVGHSYGGLIALRLALDAPHRVRRLALVEAPLPPASLGALDTYLETDPQEYLRAVPESLRRTTIRTTGRRVRRTRAALESRRDDTTLVADLRAEPDFDDAALARLPHPALCVYGTRSACRPAGERLARVLPTARLVELDGGHMLPTECPAELTRALAEFLDG